MEYKRLGSSELLVSKICLGTMTYGQQNTIAEAHEQLDYAIAQGINFIDTAEMYPVPPKAETQGKTEKYIGEWLAQPRIKQQRDQLIVATKIIGTGRNYKWLRDDAIAALSRKNILQAVDDSLKRLQTDYIDLYQIHWPLEFLLKTKDFMEVLAEEVKKGRIQSVGVSNYSAAQMTLAHQYLAEKGIPLAVNQVPYSLLTRQIEQNGVLEKAKQLGVTILAYSPLAQGLLTGKYTPESVKTLQGARRIDPRFSPKGLQKLEPLFSTLKDLSEKYDKTLAQVSLNWLVAQGNIIPIPGAKNANQAKQNAGALGWSLTPEEVELLRLKAPKA